MRPIHIHVWVSFPPMTRRFTYVSSDQRRHLPLFRWVPAEICANIFESVDRHSLYKLVVVSRVCQAEAERLLLQTVFFDGQHNIDKYCQRLLSVPRFWPLIRSLQIRFSKRETPFDGQPLHHPSLPILLEKVLSLVDLKFINGSGKDYGQYSQECGDLFRLCHFQLRTLSAPFTLDVDFLAFLETQRELLSLALYTYPRPPVSIPAGFLPALRILDMCVDQTWATRSDAIVAMNLPITHFRLTGMWYPVDLQRLAGKRDQPST
jgi:hypothetical protein